jgi:RES domain
VSAADGAADTDSLLAEPPSDLARKDIPLVDLSAGDVLYRVHRLTNEPLWFGTGMTPVNRFDDPLGEYGVCYFGCTREAAFAETLLRQPPVRLISRAFADTLGFAEFSIRRPLRLVHSHDAGLARLGATSAIASGAHGIARRWSRAFWEHPLKPDGIQYRCRHDDGEMAIALYNRSASALSEEQRFGIREDTVWFGSVLDRYGLALDD